MLAERRGVEFENQNEKTQRQATAQTLAATTPAANADAGWFRPISKCLACADQFMSRREGACRI